MSVDNINLGIPAGLVTPYKEVPWKKSDLPIVPQQGIQRSQEDLGKYLTQEEPIPAYQFSFEVDDVVVALFQKFGGMRIERAVEAFTEGGVNDCTVELPGQISYAHVTLESGLCSSRFFWNWMKAGQYQGYAYKKSFTLAQRRPSTEDGEYWKVVRQWFFINAYPVAWSISDLSVDDDSSIVIESLELTFDYFELY
jgi:phage tail-like protein